MQAGDALWQLCGVAKHLEKQGNIALAAFMYERLVVLSDFISVPAPTEEQLQQLSSALESIVVQTAPTAGYASETQPKKTNDAYSDPQLVSAATQLVEDMNESGQFEWAKLVASITEQLAGDKPFITPKQCRALRNIATGRDYGEEGTFWDWFRAEWESHSQLIDQAADAA